MIQPWVKDLVESVIGRSKMRAGKTLRHPDGRLVKIIDGQYWGTYGLSNFWTWREVKPNGKLGRKESGYGW